MTYSIFRLLAHIETGRGKDSFGQTVMKVLCGAVVPTAGSRTFVVTEQSSPMFYPVCGSCRRIQRSREVKAQK